ncbi:MAG: hypothetical protein QNJ72_20785, partial [Pleurocapsa sp. MO_226.B13]|nr:hypothetical protein [Pleurocapsa sp. MO_226.B13]
MTSNNELAQINVFGFDFGHGETALAHISGCNNKSIKPKTVFNPPTDITAIAYQTNGDVFRGQAALSSGQVNEAVDFDVCFKSKPGLNADFDQKISDFALVTYKKGIEECNLNDNENIEFFIGCPSGWDEDIKEKYQQLFTQSGLPNVTIIAESEAAYAYYFEDLKEKPEYQIPIKEYNKYPLILDFGSSTLDATVEKKIGVPISDGITLGASLIEEAILVWNLEHCLEDSYP